MTSSAREKTDEDERPGAFADETGTTFRVWATRVRRVDVRIFADATTAVRDVTLGSRGDGWFEGHVPGVQAGGLYKFVLDGRELPDPYARFVPFGVDGPAEVVRLERAWPLAGGPSLDRYVMYELHVGTFTAEGTYASAAERLPALADLGVTAIEVMPISTFPGARGWGYDGVAHFAPYAGYGRPEDLKAFVDRAHALGIAVLLDVVYNHFGPRGNYLGAYAPEYFTTDRNNPWGSAPDYTAAMMRRYLLDNARMWFDTYGFDGLRLDATHTMHDPPPAPVTRELRALASSYEPARVLVAEDDRNDPAVVTELGFDAVWADDFHHQMRVLLAGDRDGYYAAYEPSVAALARAIERGWTYEGQAYAPWGRSRGKPAGDMPRRCLVYCVQNHDQVGNRALGERLDRDVGVDALCAATVVLLFAPATPLLFMGQEWAASSPFLYFTDHDPEHGALVSKGRREEFAAFGTFSDPRCRDSIPDPQTADTFVRSVLDWDERTRQPHERVLDAVRAMLRLRREDAVLSSSAAPGDVRAFDRDGLLVVERSAGDRKRTLVANLSTTPLAVDPALPSGHALFAIGDVTPARLGAYAVVIRG